MTMDYQKDSAVIRAPPEIWWKILDETIDADIPLMFATTYEGNNWAEDSPWHMLMGKEHLYQGSEEQRKILGSVCRSWQAYARVRRNRHIELAPRRSYTDGDVVLNARHVTLWRGIIQYITPDLAREAKWEILRIDQSSVPELLPLLPHLRLRRLQLWTGKLQVFNLNHFLGILSMLNNLTWLEYEVNDFPSQVSSAYPVTNRPHASLPNLQVLFYKTRELSAFPISFLTLPSLRYLSIHFSIMVGAVSLVDLLLPFRQTIRSVAVRSIMPNEERHTLHFPPWNDFPMLEELVLDKQWSVYFERPPACHPLRRLNVHHGTLHTLSSILDAPHMREVVLQKARWTWAGGLVGDDEDYALNWLEADVLVNKAKNRDIKLEATWDGIMISRR
ncbi:hypothetical protein CPB86DRAFT_797382 [Serendipita vermifera]|nr:hypothetical protein CPB86DRAFT_797382 [Serendipita vermifera]